jgi:hypothetical protein
MASPTVDGSAINTAITSGTNTGTVTLTTTNANDIIVVVVAIENTTAQGSTNKVTSVSKTSGTGTVGSFAKRAASDGQSTNATGFQCLEIWWAVATTALTSAVITVNTNINQDDMVIAAFGVSGVGSTSSPWDPQAGLPTINVNTATTSSTQTSASTSTTNADDLIIFCSCDSNGVIPTVPTGFSAIKSGQNAAGTLEVALGVASKSVSATTSAQVYTDGSSASWIVIVDALTADAPGATAVYGWWVDVDQPNYTKPVRNFASPGDAPPALDLPPPGLLSKLQGMPWQQTRDQPFKTLPRFTDPRATDGTPPYTLPVPISGEAWQRDPDQPIYTKSVFTIPEALAPHPPSLTASIQGNGWFNPLDVAFVTKPVFTTPVAFSETSAPAPPQIAQPWDQPIYGRKYNGSEPAALAPPSPNLVASIQGNGWFNPPEVAFVTKPRVTDPEAFVEVPPSLLSLLSGIPWSEQPDQPFWTRARFTDPLGYGTPPPTVGISGMAWFEPPERAFYGIPRFTDPLAMVQVPPSLLSLLQGLPWFEPLERTIYGVPRFSDPLGMAQFPPAPTTSISGIAWFEPPEVAFIIRARFTDPRATDGTPPYTLPPPIAGMAWFEPPESGRIITRPQFTDPSATLLPQQVLYMGWYCVSDETTYPAQLITPSPSLLFPSAPPVGIAGIAWFTPPERTIYGRAQFSDSEAFAEVPPSLLSLLKGIPWSEQPDQPFWTRARFTDPLGYAVPVPPVGISGMSWFEPLDRAFYGIPRFTDPFGYAIPVPPAGISGMAWFEPLDRAFYGIPRLTDPLAMSQFPPPAPTPISGMAWFEPPGMVIISRPWFTDVSPGPLFQITFLPGWAAGHNIVIGGIAT